MGFYFCVEFKKQNKYNKTEIDLKIQKTNRWFPEERELMDR